MTAIRHMMDCRTTAGLRALRFLFAAVLSLAVSLSLFHGLASEIEDHAPPSATLVLEQAQPASHQTVHHQMADHCLAHMMAEVDHPASVAVQQDYKVQLSWHNDTAQPNVATDSPFKPPRAQV
ncbi:hypothetical protein [Afipia carboxidovorans]|uniref:hypothetical protein n=1 Tax=Afipia carboxidovorans TaxID=40137 RepID=UPI0030848D0B|nr:hypothetical protein CRBSH125_14980 [Afipia carboxidovorans]